ncbi:hypothetical protein [Brevibacterium aurantiacum]|uniref:hypothetical protein n=1 Tax=Brevibacterium aurantiacum TaxID=273384 RepID=UPI0014366D05|nr:hypothetical protein [Brevibacterium aurantiacum]
MDVPDQGHSHLGGGHVELSTQGIERTLTSAPPLRMRIGFHGAETDGANVPVVPEWGG